MFFLVNPRKKRRRASARRSSRRRSVRRTHKRKRAMPAALKAYWASKRGGRTVARRKRRRGRRRHTAVRRNPVVRSHRRRSHRRHYRRNPGFSGRGIVRSVTEGLKCGSFVVLGEAVSVTVPGLVRLPTTGLLGAGVIGLTGTVLGMVAGRFMGGTNTQYFVAGAWAKAIKQAIAPYAASIPLIGPGLSGYTPALPLQASGRARAALSGYAPRGGGGVGVSAADDGSGYIF